MDKKMIFCKRAQVGIWVILGVVLASTIILFFLISQQSGIIKPGEGESVFDAQSFIETCTRQYVEEAVELMLPHGGFVAPKNTVFFNNTEIEYICENRGFYSPCIQQHPMLLNEMKTEIREFIAPRIAGCFDDMEREFEKRNSDVNFESELGVGVNLQEDKILVDIERKTTVEKQGETRRFDSFVVVVESPLYNLGRIAMEIANQEAQYCYFEYVGYNILYPRYQIKKYTMSHPTKIYVVKDNKSRKEMNIAIRSCAIPAGA